MDDPYELAERLAAIPGVVQHGLFPPELVSMVLVGRGDTVEARGVQRVPQGCAFRPK